MLPITSLQRCGDRGRVYRHGEDCAVGRGRGLSPRNPVGKPDAGNPPVRLCVQVRLMCSAGVSPAGVKVGSPVAGGQAGGKPNDLKPLDDPILGMGASRQAVTEVNAWWPRKGEVPEAEPATVRAKAARPVASRMTRRVAPAGWLATAWWQGHIEQLEKPSSSRPETAEAG